MTRILYVAQRSNELELHEMRDFVAGASGGVHASVFRCFQVLELVKEWLLAGVPPKYVLELIEHIEELAGEHEAKEN